MISAVPEEISFLVDQEFSGQRLDRVIAAHPKTRQFGFSRAQIKQLIEASLVSVNTKVLVRGSALVSEGDNIRCRLPKQANELQGYQFTLKICFEDDSLIVIDKPAALTVHPGANTGHQTLLNALISHYQKGGKKLPPIFDSVSTSRGGIVHRIDKDTSGLLVVAKTLPALQGLAKQFAERSIGRHYHALVFSTPRGRRDISDKDSGSIDLPIGRDPKRRVAMGIGGVGQRQARTHWRVVERFPYGTLLELRLESGRTHQIRVHMNAIGCPVIGDKTYGDFSGLPMPLARANSAFGRQALHARFLEFDHPISGESLPFESQLPEDMAVLIETFRKFRPGQQ